MSGRFKRGRLYRIIAIVLAFLLIGVAVFVPILSGKDVNPIVLWVAVGIYVAAFIGTIVINEIIIYKNNKAKDGE